MNETSHRYRQCKPEHNVHGTLRIAIVCAALALLVACQSTLQTADPVTCAHAVSVHAWQRPLIHQGDESISFDAMMTALVETRVVMIGEYHTRLDHHLSQLEIICRLYESNPNLAIGVEFVQRPFQTALDAHTNGESNTQGLLADTEYFARWGYDYRLYAPIIAFAREHAIPIVALNAAAELSAKVSHAGMDSLTAQERTQVATTIRPADDDYRQRMKEVFDSHGQSDERNFESFLGVQLLWDETMAETAANYLLANPQHRLVIIAGNGHVGYRNAIPARLVDRVSVKTATIAQVLADETYDTDYQFESEELTLPKAGLMGVLLNERGDVIEIGGFSKNSAAKAAGVITGDVLLSIDGRPISSYVEVKLTLWPKIPGEEVVVGVERAGEQLTIDLTLR